MKFSEALREIARFYLPGTVQFYSRQNPDPWDAMMRQVERGITDSDPGIQATAAAFYVSRARELVENFRVNGSPAKKISEIDAFMLGPGGGLSDWISIKEKCCYRCKTKVGLEIEPIEEDDSRVRLVCRECRLNRSRKNY